MPSTAPTIGRPGQQPYEPLPGGGASAGPRNFEEFIYKVWGAGIARHFAIPYNRKLWTAPLSEMETSWLGGRVPLPDLGEIIDGALRLVAKTMGPNARFGYPKRGGFQALMNGFLPHIRGKVELNASAVSLLPGKHAVVLADGRRLSITTPITPSCPAKRRRRWCWPREVSG